MSVLEYYIELLGVTSEISGVPPFLNFQIPDYLWCPIFICLQIESEAATAAELLMTRNSCNWTLKHTKA